MTNPLQHALAKIIGDAIFGHVHPDETPDTWGQSMSAAQNVLAAIVVNAAKAQTTSSAPTYDPTTTGKVTGGLWDQLTVLSGYYITQPPTPDHEFVQVCNGDLRKMVELMNTSVQAPAPHLVWSELTIIRLPWHKEPNGDFWRAEVIGHVYEVHDDEMADYKKRQCQYDFEARIRSVLAPIATTEGSDNVR